MSRGAGRRMKGGRKILISFIVLTHLNGGATCILMFTNVRGTKTPTLNTQGVQYAQRVRLGLSTPLDRHMAPMPA